MNSNLHPRFITHSIRKMRTTNSSDVLSPTIRLAQCTGLALLVTFGLGLTGCSDNQPTAPSEPAPSSEPAPDTTAPADSTASTATVSTETPPADTNMGAEPTVADTDNEPETSEPTGESETTTATEAAPTTNEPELSADAGKQLYESHCQQCHQGGLLGAPKYGDKAAWEPRIAQGKDTLYIHSAKGFKKMPAQATGDVSVAQVHAAVDYMVAGSS